MVGEKLGSFRIEGTLGVGAMGVVYKATHEPSGKAGRGQGDQQGDRPAAATPTTGSSARPNILKQFRHPNIVRFLALGRYQGTSYIAMEFIQGKTIEQTLKAPGPSPGGTSSGWASRCARRSTTPTSTASSTATSSHRT